MKNLHIRETVKQVAEWLRSRKILVVGLILVAVFAVPRSSPAQLLPSPCCAILSIGLASVTGAIHNVVGTGLSTIRSKERRFYAEGNSPVVLNGMKVISALCSFSKFLVNQYRIQLLHLNIESRGISGIGRRELSVIEKCW
jgi:hypothetical protein